MVYRVSKVEENKRKKKDALLSAAFTLFTEKGIHETSISDIVKRANLAKGTFYLYFKDKYDIERRLVASAARQLFVDSYEELAAKREALEFEDEVVGLIDGIVNRLNQNKSLLKFISKNLGWGVFYRALTTPKETDELDFNIVYEQLLQHSGHRYRNPKLMIYMIVELVSSTIHNVILYSDPVSLEQLKPDLYLTVRHILKNQCIEA